MQMHLLMLFVLVSHHISPICQNFPSSFFLFASIYIFLFLRIISSYAATTNQLKDNNINKDQNVEEETFSYFFSSK